MTKKSVVIVGAVIVLAALVGVGLNQWMITRAMNESIAENLPPMPDLSSWSGEMNSQVTAAYQNAVEGRDALESLKTLCRLYHANGFLSESMQCYEILIALQPDEPRWNYLYASILASYGRLEEATTLWEKMVAAESDYVVAYIRLGDALYKMNEFKRAESIFRKALEIDSGNAYAYQGLGRVEMARGNWKKARDYLEVGAQSSNYRIGIDLLASVYQELGLEEKARSIWSDHSIGTFSDIPDPWASDLLDVCYDTYRLATAGGNAAYAGNSELGIKLLERAADMDQEDPMVQYQLGALALNTGDYPKAEKYLKRCVELKPDLSDGWYQLFVLYQKMGDNQASLTALQRGFALCPNSPALLMEMGIHYRSKGLIMPAISMLEKSIELRPNEALAYIQLAQVYFQQNKVEKAIEQMERALVAEPGNPVALSTLTLFSIQTGDETLAEKYMQRVYLQPRIDKDRLELEETFKKKFGHLPNYSSQ